MKNQYTKDSDNKDIIFNADGYQIMMEWEKPYMEALIDNLNPSGDVLEIGFGFGYSASKITEYPINSYTVIERDDVSIEKAHQWAKHQKCDVTIVKGLWQNEIHRLNQKFDSIFFDDSVPLENDSVDLDYQRGDSSFEKLILTKLAKKGCRYSFYTCVPPWWNCHPATKYSCKTMKLDIPEHCADFTDKMKKNKTMFLPLIEYPYGALTEDEMQIYTT